MPPVSRDGIAIQPFLLTRVRHAFSIKKYKSIEWQDRIAPVPHSKVGSRSGARTVGTGGNSITFVMDRSPATMITFPAPASSNAGCGFPALRFPIGFSTRVMRPILLGVLSAPMHNELDKPLNSFSSSYSQRLLHLFQPKPRRFRDRPMCRRIFFSTQSLMKQKHSPECPTAK